MTRDCWPSWPRRSARAALSLVSSTLRSAASFLAAWSVRFLRLDEGLGLFGLVAAAGELEVWSVDHDRPMQGQGAGGGVDLAILAGIGQKAQRSHARTGDWSQCRRTRGSRTA